MYGRYKRSYSTRRYTSRRPYVKRGYAKRKYGYTYPSRRSYGLRPRRYYIGGRRY